MDMDHLLLSPASSTPNSKSSAQLIIKEIAALEIQILRLETYLLSLYRRAAFTNHQPFLHSHHTHSSNLSFDEAPADTRHRTLADHFNTLNHPAQLSQQILRCMSCIYCKFASPPKTSSSTSSSMSSSTTFSPQNVSASWSPQSSHQTKSYFEDTGATIQVLRISLDDDGFKYAATMLQKFRSLVQSLENVDPRKMKREEKLAFWLNIHNALVMHGYLAYGTHNFATSSSILKAAYNVGGHCINAHVIQGSILGVRSHYSAPWLQSLLSPRKKKTTKHIYSLEYPEPLVHFALCSGSWSDPLLRVYSANSIFQDLKVARDDFIRATVYMEDKEAKLYLPKVMCHFAREMSMSRNELLKTVWSCVPDLEQKAMRRSIIKGREEKCVCWIPQSSTFRFLIHKEDVFA